MKAKSPAPKYSAAIVRRARRIRLLLVDVDGVMTDGGIRLLSWPDGTVTEMKQFYSQDGVSLKLLLRAGVRTGMITGRESVANAHRAREMGMDFVAQKTPEKLPAFEEILARAGLTAEETAYVGDDLPDLPVLKRAGLAVAVANATTEVKRIAHFTTRAAGGAGALREVAELILRAQGKWGDLYPSAQA